MIAKALCFVGTKTQKHSGPPVDPGGRFYVDAGGAIRQDSFVPFTNRYLPLLNSISTLYPFRVMPPKLFCAE